MRALRHLHRLLPAFLLLAFGCNNGEWDYQTPVDWVYRPPAQVNDGWESASLQSVGVDRLPLVTLMNELRAHGRHLVHGIVIVRHGKLVFEEYFPGLTHPTFGEEPVVFDRETTHCLSSVTKSFTATLLGIAIERGFIAGGGGIDQKVLELFPELEDLNVGQRRDVTLEHLVTMTSGLEWDERSYSLRDSRNDLTAWMSLARTTSEDLVRAVLARPMVATPTWATATAGGSRVGNTALESTRRGVGEGRVSSSCPSSTW